MAICGHALQRGSYHRSRLRIVGLWTLCMSVTLSGCGETMQDRAKISRHIEEIRGVAIENSGAKEGEKALRELIAILKGDNNFASCQACDALGELGPAAAPAVPDLIREAKSLRPFVSQDAVGAMAKLGPTAAPALDFLKETVELAVKHDSYDLRSLYAVDFLGNVGPKAANARLLLERGCRSSSYLLSERCKRALEKLDNVVGDGDAFKQE